MVGRATQSTPVKNALSGTWLGHQLHPVLTDVTIGAWLSAAAVDVVAGDNGADSARRLTALGIVSAIPTAASGLSDWAETYGPDQRVGVAHALGNTAGLTLQIASYAARRRGRRILGATLSMTGLGVVAAAGYLAGHLVYARGVGVNHTAFEHRPTNWTDRERPASKTPRRCASTPTALQSWSSRHLTNCSHCQPPACTQADRLTRVSSSTAV